MQNSLSGFDVFGETFLGISPAPATAYAIVSRAEGVDPVSEKMTLITSGVIEIKSSKRDHERLAQISKVLENVIETDTPIAVGMYDVGFRSGISHHQYKTAKVIGLVSAIAFGHDMKMFMLEYMGKQAEQEMRVWKDTGKIVSDKRLLKAIGAALDCAVLWQVRK